jgi:hypothetical protein
MTPPSFFPFADLAGCKLFVRCPSGLVGQLAAVYGNVTPAGDDALAVVVVLDGAPKMVLAGGFVTTGVPSDFAFVEGGSVWPAVAVGAPPVASGHLPACLRFTGSLEVTLAGANGSPLALAPESGLLVSFGFAAGRLA